MEHSTVLYQETTQFRYLRVSTITQPFPYCQRCIARNHWW